jgi:hypothetical protein
MDIYETDDEYLRSMEQQLGMRPGGSGAGGAGGVGVGAGGPEEGEAGAGGSGAGGGGEAPQHQQKSSVVASSVARQPEINKEQDMVRKQGILRRAQEEMTKLRDKILGKFVVRNKTTGEVRIYMKIERKL